MKKRILIFFIFFLFSAITHSVESVNPTGVNVRSNGPTTVFLTFRGTAGQQSTDAFWCGEINVPANTVTSANPCVPGTLFGNLPDSLNLGQASAGLQSTNEIPPPAPNPAPGDTDLPQKPFLGRDLNGPVFGRSNGDNFTDVMTIPASVARRAMQSARAGNNSSFFYVRKFESGGADQYIAVTCRMAGGGARVPFSLIDVRPSFESEDGFVPVHLAALGEAIPKPRAEIKYNGSGRLSGRWELVMPGESTPSEFDLLPEASLPIEQRGLQKRYTLLERFDVFLPPTGEYVLESKLSELIKTEVIGPYQILLRIEATRDKEGDSDTGIGSVNSGGVAGFAIPALRYYVASEDDVSRAKRSAGVEKNISLFAPGESSLPSDISRLIFAWQLLNDADLYLLEVKMPSGKVFKAVKRRTEYDAPPWVVEALRMENKGAWRVSALDNNGRRIGRSDWRALKINIEETAK